jgi:dimethylhistidine N-methyltransferase
MAMPNLPAAPFGRTRFMDMAPGHADFAAAVIDGLSRAQKALPGTFFHDETGLALFQRLCDQPEYYLARAEQAILERAGAPIAALLGPAVQLVELGRGPSGKVRCLLDRLVNPLSYAGIDLSRDHLRRACDGLAAAYPWLEIMALCADYTGDVPVPPPQSGFPRRRVAFFPGSVIGNLSPAEAEDFLVRWRDTLRFGGAEGGGMLVGVDLRKDPALLEAAYDDRAGVTAAFNLNLLAHINQELGGTFNLANFRHMALWDEQRSCVSMYLVSRRDQIVRAAGQRFAILEGEAIHTEDCHKYSIEGFQALARQAGYRPAAVWTDPQALFSLHWLEA